MTFPRLKSGAITQLPFHHSICFETHVVRFLDGSEQRAPLTGRPLRRWFVALETVDESEAAGLDRFFRDLGASGSAFAFVDPVDGAEYPDCSIEHNSFELIQEGPGRCRTGLVVRENRN